MTKFSRSVPDYGLALSKSIEILEEVEIGTTPIYTQQIAKRFSRTIHLTSYKKFSEETGLTVDEIISAFNSEDGACVYEKQTEKYIIFFNEDKPIERMRFTIAHELGHIFLEHHKIAGNDILARSELSSKEYEMFEKEANCFARNLLSPAPLAKIIRDSDESQLYVTDCFQKEFNIGIQASQFRLGFLDWDLNKTTTDINNYIMETFPEYRRCCRSCQRELTNACLYCPYCGTRQVKNNKSFNYKPVCKDIISCYNCGFQTSNLSAKFCIICGHSFSNYCTNVECLHRNLPSASYCNKCGSETKLHKDLQTNLAIDNEGVDILEYKDGVKYDGDTFRVLICPKCENEEFSQDATYCRICGLNLFNLCPGKPQISDMGDEYRDEQHRNPSNARFCETCGEKTLYFDSGILSDYETYKKETANSTLPF